MKATLIVVCFVLFTAYAVNAQSYLSALQINAKADRTAPIKNLGSTYGANKRRHVEALKRAGLYDGYLAMAVAIGMQETSTFNPADYDYTKKGDSTNYSAFNLNKDMMVRAGIQPTDAMNTWNGVDAAAAAIKKMVTQYGVNGFLNYLRGGYTAWKDGVSYDAAGYRNAIASIVRHIDNDRSLLTDDRRVEMYTIHQR